MVSQNQEEPASKRYANSTAMGSATFPLTADLHTQKFAKPSDLLLINLSNQTDFIQNFLIHISLYLT